MEESEPRVNERSYLFEIQIEEKSDGRGDYLKLGLISSKYFEPVPEFMLYRGESELRVRIQCVNDNLILGTDEIESLRRFNKLLFVHVLRNESFQFEDRINAGLFFVFKSKPFTFKKPFLYFNNCCIYDC